jgi:indole-3-glycerol phosphate synthase
MQRADGSFLETLAQAAKVRVRDGYYLTDGERSRKTKSLLTALKTKQGIPVIAEVKFRSPTEGTISKGREPGEIAKAYERGGAVAISVLTEPENFGGSLASLSIVVESVNIPVMMKDIVVDPAQVEAAARSGADAILLIFGIFSSGLANRPMEEMVELAHGKKLEVVVEVHDEDELDTAFRSRADIIGINNRNLRTLSVNRETSEKLLLKGYRTKPVICESGIGSREDIDRLRVLGADGFLVGTALMKSEDPEATLRELIMVGPR